MPSLGDRRHRFPHRRLEGSLSLSREGSSCSCSSPGEGSEQQPWLSP